MASQVASIGAAAGAVGERAERPSVAADVLSSSERRPHYAVTFAILALAVMATAVLQSLVAPALGAIQLGLGPSTTGASWVLTALLLSASVATPVLGRLGDMLGKKRVLVFALTATVVGRTRAAGSDSPLKRTVLLSTSRRRWSR